MSYFLPVAGVLCGANMVFAAWRDTAGWNHCFGQHAMPWRAWTSFVGTVLSGWCTPSVINLVLALSQQ